VFEVEIQFKQETADTVNFAKHLRLLLFMTSETFNTPEPVALQKKERKKLITDQVNIHTRLLFTDLVKLINVSEDTIRRDVNELADEGQVIRIKGGVMSAAYHLAHESQFSARRQQEIVANKALQLLQNDMIVLIDGDATIREFIRKIPDTLTATFITVNLLTAVELLDKPNLKTIIIGGQVAAHSQMTVSGEVFQYLNNIKADLCILGANALDAGSGLTTSDWDTFQVKKAMTGAAGKLAVLTTSDKLNSAMHMKIADVSKIDYLITELAPDNHELQAYNSRNITLL
jgi:DeoR family transcriptional regulator, fructose operon transcriptional repressor